MATPTRGTAAIAVAPAGNGLIDPLLTGWRWPGSTVSYSFPEAGALWSTEVATGYGPRGSVAEPWSQWYQPLSDADRPFFQQALDSWAAVAGLQFTQVTESAAAVGDIRAAYSWLPVTDDAAAWAYAPSPFGAPLGGDVWFNAFDTAASEVWTPGGYAYFSVLHELGHAIGLKHPFEGPSVLPAAWNNQGQTVMSYTASSTLAQAFFTYWPTTPMVLDIQAIQYAYGANLATGAGNDTYAFDDLHTWHETLWDAGGFDTVRYDGSRPATIDLRAGFGSTIGNPVEAVSVGGLRQAVPNVWVALGVTLEQAVGGSGSDRLVGNDGANWLSGRGGNDQLEGGAGSDTAVFGGRLADYRIAGNRDHATVTAKTGADGQDSLSSIETLAFADLQVDLGVKALAAALPPATKQRIVELYVAFFDRVPEGSGLAFWFEQAAQGASLDAIADAFYAAAIQHSALTGYSAQMGSGDFVRVIYRNVLGRAEPDAEGLAFWSQALDAGSQTRGSLVKAILDSAHSFKGNAEWGWVADLLDNKFVVGRLSGVDLGLAWPTPEESIARGMAIADAVTPTDIQAAIALIGVTLDDVQLA